MLEKLIYETSSSQLWLDRTQQNKSPSCHQPTKGSLQNVSWTRFDSLKNRTYDIWPCHEKVKTSLQTSSFPPRFSDMLEYS